MSEVVSLGPLDIIRNIAGEAEELDVLARDHLKESNVEMLDDFAAIVYGLNATHPLTQQDVIVYGMPLTLSVEGNQPRPFAVPTSKEYARTLGRYAGLTVKETYDPRSDSCSFRVVHMVHTGSSDALPDAFGNMQQTHFYDYICVTGSEVVPVDPLNAHSLEDLKQDGITAEIDRIALSEESDMCQPILDVGRLMNAVLERHGDYSTVNHQRVSYLNSLGLLDEVVMVTGDFVLGDRGAYEASQELAISDDSIPFDIYPNTSQIANGYDRVRIMNDILLGGPPELFVNAKLGNGQEIFAPIKGVKKVLI